MARWKARRKPANSSYGAALTDGHALELAEPETVPPGMGELDRSGGHQLLGLHAALEEMAHLRTVADAVPPLPKTPEPFYDSAYDHEFEFEPGQVTGEGPVRTIRITGQIEALIEVENPPVDLLFSCATLPPDAGAAFEILAPRCPPKWAEALRKLRGRLLEEKARREANGGRLCSIAITSPRRASGRSSTARNLAACLGVLPEVRVLLIDADVMRPSLHRRLKVAQSPGLAESIAARDHEWHRHIRRVPHSGLHVLSLGTARSGIDGLDLSRLPRFLERAGNAFSWIVLDAAPMDTADGEALANIADGAILLLRNEREYFDEADAAVHRLDPRRLLGAILNFA